MDISHVYRISKHLDTLEEWPCCRSTGEEDFITTPTKLSFEQLVNDLPCLARCDLGELENPSHNRSFESLIEQRVFQFLDSKSYSPRQNRAIDAFRVIHGEVSRNLKASYVNIRDVKQYAACFDDLLFGGRLMKRCAIEYSNHLSPGVGGETGGTYFCYTHQQVHAVGIHLRRDTCRQDVSPKLHLQFLLGLLLHELCHAWVTIYLDLRGMTVEDALHDHGATFHGRVWRWVMRIGIIATSRLLGLNIDEDLHFNDCVDKDSRTEYEIRSLKEKIAWSPPEYPGCL